MVPASGGIANHRSGGQETAMPRHFIVTGGTGALGASVVPALLRQDSRLTIPFIDQASADRLIESLSGVDRSRVVLTETDLRDEASVNALFEKCPAVDGLVHLAGTFAMGRTDDFSLAAFRQQMDLNLTSLFLMTRAVLPAMRKAGYGRIVAVGSRAAEQPMAQAAAYSAAKAGVVAFIRAIAEETKGTGITANVVLPSVIDTAANRKAMGTAGSSKWVEPSSIAGVIEFLASEAAGDLRGTAVRVYGDA
jgi:NAD(P)-dependent dehydrogenase (short-subunit alcohol dehydrogenase family)